MNADTTGGLMRPAAIKDRPAIPRVAPGVRPQFFCGRATVSPRLSTEASIGAICASR